MSEIEIILDNLFWLGFKLCMAGKLETAPNESLAEAEQAINAYILGEVMELLKDEPYEAKAHTIKYPIPEGAKYLQVPVVGIEKFVYQELRNKANKKWGKL